jgi:hypothetical protein
MVLSPSMWTFLRVSLRCLVSIKLLEFSFRPNGSALSGCGPLTTPSSSAGDRRSTSSAADHKMGCSRSAISSTARAAVTTCGRMQFMRRPHPIQRHGNRLPVTDTFAPAPRPTYRLIPTQFPLIGLFDTVATTADLSAVMELVGWTNDRVVAERIGRLPQSEWVHGVPNASGPSLTLGTRPRPGKA